MCDSLEPWDKEGRSSDPVRTDKTIIAQKRFCILREPCWKSGCLLMPSLTEAGVGNPHCDQAAWEIVPGAACFTRGGPVGPSGWSLRSWLRLCRSEVLFQTSQCEKRSQTSVFTPLLKHSNDIQPPPQHNLCFYFGMCSPSLFPVCTSICICLHSEYTVLIFFFFWLLSFQQMFFVWFLGCVCVCVWK